MIDFFIDIVTIILDFWIHTNFDLGIVFSRRFLNIRIQPLHWRSASG